MKLCLLTRIGLLLCLDLRRFCFLLRFYSRSFCLFHGAAFRFLTRLGLSGSFLSGQLRFLACLGFGSSFLSGQFGLFLCLCLGLRFGLGLCFSLGLIRAASCSAFIRAAFSSSI